MQVMKQFAETLNVQRSINPNFYLFIGWSKDTTEAYFFREQQQVQNLYNIYQSKKYFYIVKLNRVLKFNFLY
jgi:hypothetical protein